jgi:tRNA(adenine34) deaminase
MLTKLNPVETDSLIRDTEMMRRCIRLSAIAAEQGEFPFAALICEGDRVVVETTNLVVQRADVTRHAELVAVSEAQKILGRKDLSTCTLYSNVEPCAMCSFPVRETRIGRVIYAISSPIMGGYSKWNVLRDTEIADVMPEAFGPVPEVIAGLCRDEAEQVWRAWNPVVWAVIKHRGYLGHATVATPEHLQAIAPRTSRLRKLLTTLYKRGWEWVAAAKRHSGH